MSSLLSRNIHKILPRINKWTLSGSVCGNPKAPVQSTSLSAASSYSVTSISSSRHYSAQVRLHRIEMLQIYFNVISPPGCSLD